MKTKAKRTRKTGKEYELTAVVQIAVRSNRPKSALRKDIKKHAERMVSGYFTATEKPNGIVFLDDQIRISIQKIPE